MSRLSIIALSCVRRYISVRSVPLAPSAVLLLLLCNPLPAASTTTVPLSLEEMVKASSVIFAGTVSRIDVLQEPGRTFPVLTISFSDVTYAKGRLSQKRQSLRIFGRTPAISLPDLPTFELHHRYIVVAREDPSNYFSAHLPIIGFYQGFFPVEAETPGGNPTVHDPRNRPIARATRAQITVIGPSDSNSSKVGSGGGIAASESAAPTQIIDKTRDPGTRVLEADFLSLLRSIERTN